MTKEQALALARARLALKRKQQPAPPARPTLEYTQGPVEDPQMSMDALSVSEAGIDTSPETRRAAIRNFLQGVTFGTADEMEAALRSTFGDRTYEENIDMIRSEMSAFQQERPGEALTQEGVGALMSPASLLKGPAYIEQAAPLVRGGIKGGVGGFVYGAGSAEGDVAERVEEGFVGAGTGLIIGAPLEKLASSIGNSRLNQAIQQQSKAPSVERLKELKDAAYSAVDQTNFSIGPGEAREIFKRASEVADNNFYKTMPNTVTAVDKAQNLLRSLTSGGMTLGQSEKVRRRLFDLASDPTEGYIVREMIDEFDDVIDTSLAAGQVPQLKIAREANRKYKNSQAIENAFERADIKVGKRTEGYQKMAKSLLNNKKQMKFFSEKERQVLEELATGSPSQNLLNTLGRFQFTAKGMAGALNFYTMTTAPWIALLFVGTGGAKYLADRKAITTARKLINQAGGVEAVKKASQNPNSATLTLGGVTADQIREELSLEQ